MNNKITGRTVFKQALTLAFSLLACAAIQAADAEKAEKFVQQAGQTCQMELKIAQLAQQKAAHQDVKALAASLVKDHTEMNQKLQQVAQKLNVQIPQGTDPKFQSSLSKLQSESGAGFDKHFVKQVIKLEKKRIHLWEKAANEVDDPEVKAFIDQRVGKLRETLQTAQTAAKSAGLLDEAGIAAALKEGEDEATGAPASGVKGEGDSKTDKPQP